MRTDGSGNVEGTYTSLPFGDGYSASGVDWDAYHFGQLDRDSETDTSHAQFRQYSSTEGRWMSPDPYSGSYDAGDPQSFNRYSYVMNNPLGLVDPSGLASMCADPATMASGFCVGMDESGLYASINDALNLPVIDTTTVSTTTLLSDLGDWGGTSNLGLFSYQSLGAGGVGGTAGPSTAPSNAQEPPPPCQAKILNATNNQFGTNYTNANVTNTFNYSTGAGPGQGTLNLNINGSTAGVSTGYYPVHWWTYAIGFGPTLHVVGGDVLDSPETLQFGPNQGTFHIDSGFPYNPIGAFAHWLLNMTKAGGYPKC